ncbi:MAG TPA: sigma-54 dependent transcriptional regulator [Planctomycetota bacterium]|nr:sigma-54 dependent transcriptional regulator [Planctomycetota bacterium]
MSTDERMSTHHFHARLLDASEQLVLHDNPGNALDGFLDATLQRVEGERAMIFVRRGSKLALLRYRNFATPPEAERLRIASELVEIVFEVGTGLVLLEQDLRDNHRFQEAGTARGDGELAYPVTFGVAPIFAQRRPVGAIYVDMRKAHDDASFDEKQREALRRAAAQAKPALARLTEQAIEEAQRAPSVADPLLARAVAPILGVSAETRAVRETVGRIATSDKTVLVLGASGTGKELIARALHVASGRTGAFVAENVAAIPETLLDSRLFGHEKGAFTDASRSEPGLFQLAHEGTLFLDEIGDASLDLQAKLLRVIETGEVRPVGSSKTVRVTFRLVAATNKNLAIEVAKGQFLEGLLYRLGVLVVRLAPLAARRDDIEPIALEALAVLARAAGRKPPRLAPEVLEKLEHHSWPGNVRELLHVLEVAWELSRGDIGPEHVLFVAAPTPAKKRRTLAERMADLYREVLQDHQGSVPRAAEELEVPPSTVRRNKKRYKL